PRTAPSAPAAELREDLEPPLADLPLKHARKRWLVEGGMKWRRRNPRFAAIVVATALTTILMGAPAATFAMRHEQMARQRNEWLRDAAQLKCATTLDEIRGAQILLSTQ